MRAEPVACVPNQLRMRAEPVACVPNQLQLRAEPVACVPNQLHACRTSCMRAVDCAVLRGMLETGVGRRRKPALLIPRGGTEPLIMMSESVTEFNQYCKSYY